MLRNSPLANQNFQSPLQNQSALKSSRARMKKTLMFSLSLTSLIDAFSILVIYLLMSFGTGEEVQLGKDVVLPTAVKTDLMQQGLVVRITRGQIFVADKPISVTSLAKALLDNRPKNKDEQNLIIQADRALDYKAISPVLQAGSHAGFEKYKLAVVPEGAI